MIVTGLLGGDIVIWDIESGEPIRSIESGHSGDIARVIYSPNDDFIISGSYDDSIRAFDTQTGDQLILLDQHDDDVQDIVFSADSLMMISVDAAGIGYIWGIGD